MTQKTPTSKKNICKCDKREKQWIPNGGSGYYRCKNCKSFIPLEENHSQQENLSKEVITKDKSGWTNPADIKLTEDDWKIVEARLQKDIDDGKGEELGMAWIGGSND